MKPEISTVMAALGDRLTSEIVPALTGFSAANVAMTAAMMKMVAEEWDRAASRLVEENASMRAIFLRCKDLCDGLPVQEAAQTVDSDLRISALQASNDRLRALLTDVHARVEQSEGAEARAIESLIWAELRQSVERRRISSANF